MAERKTPILLGRGPLSGEVFAFFDYIRTPRIGMTDLITAKGNGKQSVQADYDALLLEELLGESTAVVTLMENLAKGYVGELDEGDRIEIRAFVKRLNAVINRHNARIGTERHPHVES